MSRDAFWTFQLESSAAGFYGRWREPKALRRLFEEFVDYCHKSSIDLIIIAPPTHVDLQQRVSAFHLEAAHRAYLNTMKSSGRFLDFDTDNLITNDRANFDDPFHAHPDVMRSVVREIVEDVKRHNAGVASP